MNSFPPVCGIVAEYNPFHGGHRFHIERTREMLGEHTIIVCAMSGNFVQRGDFALLDKYARAEMAVRGGADLVLELPLAAALSSAEGFAQGAVALLHKIGCDTLSFGAENADISLFLQAADALNALSLTGGSRSGLSFAAQRQQELAGRSPAAAELLSSPNNTLGIEYCRALARFSMRPIAVERRGAGHDETAPSGGFASASLLRRALREGNERFCLPYLPEASAEIYRRERERGGAPVSLPESTLLALLRSALFRGVLASGTADGFDERLQSAVYSAVSFSDAVEKARTRRFPAARVRRALLRSALGLAPSASPLPQYARVLALGRTAFRSSSNHRRKSACRTRCSLRCGSTPLRTTCTTLRGPCRSPAADITAKPHFISRNKKEVTNDRTRNHRKLRHRSRGRLHRNAAQKRPFQAL